VVGEKILNLGTTNYKVHRSIQKATLHISSEKDVFMNQKQAIGMITKKGRCFPTFCLVSAENGLSSHPFFREPELSKAQCTQPATNQAYVTTGYFRHRIEGFCNSNVAR